MSTEQEKARSKAYYYANKAECLAKAKAYRLAHLDAIRERTRQYRADHKEEIRERKRRDRVVKRTQIKATQRAWYLLRKEHVKAKSRARYHNKRETIRKQAKLRAARNAVAIRAYKVKYRQDNRAQIYEACARRRAMKQTTAVARVSFKKLLASWDGNCGICRLAVEGQFHYDHIIPLASGGSHTADNIQITHPLCNLQKGAKRAVA